MPLTLLDMSEPWDKADARIICPNGTRVDLSDALLGARYYGSRGDGCYIELQVADIEREILSPDTPLGKGQFDKAEYLMKSGGCVWMITQCEKTDDGFTLTLTDAMMARAQRRRLSAAFKASRGSKTRIRFVETLLEKAGFHVYAPSADQALPIQGLTAADVKALQDTRKSAAATNALQKKTVYVLGDDLAVGAEAELEKTLGDDWSVHEANSTGRTSSQAATIISGLDHLAPTLVIQIGTADTDVATFRNNVATIMQKAGDNRRVIWVNIAGTSVATDLNAELTQAQTLHSNLEIVDWHGAVTRGDVNLADSTHPDAKGYLRRGRMIAAKIKGGA